MATLEARGQRASSTPYRMQQGPLEHTLQPGARLAGRYELLRPVAQGGMAVVWLARVQGGLGFEKLHAVKTILPHLARDPAFRAMFLDEASIASRIRHANVASLDDLGEEEGTLFMVLEWLHGDSLARLLDTARKSDTRIPMNVILRILADAAAGLHAAHDLRGDDGNLLGVVHRDVSPQNIFVTTSGVTKVIDFGIAKARERLSEQTRAGLVKGKAEYSAPEQVRGRGVDRRADVWALGTMLYHYLAGRFPYEGRDDVATLRALASGKPPPPLPDNIPPQVALVAMTALNPSRPERYQTAADMQRALESCMTEPTTATDVAACLQQHLGQRIEARRRDIAEALELSNQRAGGAPRGRLASIPELAPLDARDLSRGLEPATRTSQAVPREAKLALRHWLIMTAAVLVTAGVWGMILLVLFSPATLTSLTGSP
jgi:serine/threonine-protein kinase